MSDAGFLTTGAPAIPITRDLIPRASLADTLSVLGDVLLPTIAKGVIIRRPWVLRIAEWLDLDRRAIRRMQRIRDRRGSGLLPLRIPGRDIAMVLDPADVERILAATPVPFATDTKEKIAALSHFEPKNVLISHGADRAERRAFNEEVLDYHQAAHRLAGAFLKVVEAEADRLMEAVARSGLLGWTEFSEAWFRIVRRIIFGNSASDDDELSTIMSRLRQSANWAFLAPRRTEMRDRLPQRIRTYLARSEGDSLCGFMAHLDTTSATAPAHQVPQWLFAFDPAGMSTFRALAMLASHPDDAAQVRREIESHTGESRQVLPFARAVVLDTLRLWPTTPLILRETTAPTEWTTGVLPAGTALVIFAPFFHRDSERLEYADRFTPRIWLDNRARALVPFSEGPAECPGRNLVLLLSTAMLAAILDRARVRLRDNQRLWNDPLPATLNHFALRFQLLPRA